MKNENYKKEKVYIIAWDASFREHIHFYKALLSKDSIIFDYKILLVDFYNGNSKGFKKASEDLKNASLPHKFFLMKNKKKDLWNYGKCINFVIKNLVSLKIGSSAIVMIPDADVYIPTNTYNAVYKNIFNKTNLINYIPRYDQLNTTSDYPLQIIKKDSGLETLLDKQYELLNLTNYAGFVSFHLKDLLDIGGYEEHSFFDGPGALGKDLYLRFRNYGKKIQWLNNYKIFHPQHSNSGGKLMSKNNSRDQSLILDYRQKNINYYPIRSRLCYNLLKIDFIKTTLEIKNKKETVKTLFLKTIKNKLSLPVYFLTGANKRILLASFPKSGNTWIRFILGNIYNKIEKQTNSIDFYSIHKIIPEQGQKALEFKNLPQIFKTHGLYEKNFEKVILILRNPSDTLYSYYKYLNGEK
ncbi:MAG TPA: hypothetical protein ENI61_05815, partial [Ignavibacteria bacterium]|nr:hypothetical protein [Ignavibacteria bacterium]